MRKQIRQYKRTGALQTTEGAIIANVTATIMEGVDTLSVSTFGNSGATQDEPAWWGYLQITGSPQLDHALYNLVLDDGRQGLIGQFYDAPGRLIGFEGRYGGGPQRPIANNATTQ